MSKHRVAIVGCGLQGVGNMFDPTLPMTYSFAGAVLKHPNAEIVALVDIKEDLLADMSQKLSAGGHAGGFSTHANLADAIALHREQGNPIDIVCCAVNSHVNAQVVLRAPLLGVKGVYIDKPMSLSLADADRLVEIAHSSGIATSVNYVRNFDKHHRAALEYVREGGLGNLLYARCLYKGGLIMVAAHAFALLHLLFGKPKETMGWYSPLINGRAPEDPNVDGYVRYHFAPEGRDINVAMMATGRGQDKDGKDLDNKTYLFEFEFCGTKERITLPYEGRTVRYERMEESRLWGQSETTPYQSDNIPLQLAWDPLFEGYTQGFADLVESVETGRQTNCSIALARDAEEVCHALAVSAALRQPVSLPLADRSHVFKRSVGGIASLRGEAGRAS